MIRDKKDTASVWKALNITTKGKSAPEIPSHMSADILNNHFLATAETLALSAANNSKPYEVPSSLREHSQKTIISNTFIIPNITIAEVGRYISSMPNKTSAGIDGIDNETLKISLPYTVESLTYIFNLCIKQSTFPTILKKAKVIPIPKSKDLEDINNYRPISLLSALSKPLEKHIQKHLLDFLEKNKLLNIHQSGFRPKHSCQSALTHIVDSWLESINKSLMSGAVFLDLKKAFDLVDHDILLNKLTVYHLNATSIAFFRSYLEDRKQKVYAHGRYSKQGNVNYGVPQGSILGPLLFILFINDLPLHITNSDVNCNLFADDTSLHVSGKKTTDINQSLQCSLNEVSDWCRQNHMVLHPAKTKSILIATRQKHQRRLQPLQLQLNAEPVEQVMSVNS
jgi:hypothetical protein